MKKGAVNFNKNKIDQLKVQIKEWQEKAENIPQWITSAKNFVPGNDFGGSDETVLTRLYKAPVMVYKWPKAIKAFYMKQNDDGKTVRALDLLFPKIGEVIGGSQREEEYDKLNNRIKELDLPENDLWWYLETRKYGTVPHSGFGLGFERMVQFITGMGNIRDVIPFPRTPGSAAF